jgi:hypothetical protein
VCPGIMALKTVLVAFTCVIGLAVAALAQSPAQNMAARANCCVPDDGSAAAAAVLLPPTAIAPTDSCCQTPAQQAPASDSAAHQGATMGTVIDHANHAMAGMACCDHAVKPAGAAHDDGACCQDMQDLCAMGCCGAAVPPRH